MTRRRWWAAVLLAAGVAAGAATAWGQSYEGPVQPSRPPTTDRDRPDTNRPDSDRPDADRKDTDRKDTDRKDTDRQDTDRQDRDDRRPDAVRRAPTPSGLDPSDPVRVADPRHDVVLIFNHGTARPQRRHPCRRSSDIPPVVKTVARQMHWRVHYLCSAAVDGDRQGSYTYKRAREIERVVDAYRAKGLPASRIFLLGQSAGGWASLIAARRFGAKFNAVIAFAPAFAGPRYEAQRYPWWRFEIRPRQVKDILQAGRLHALVFAFPEDIYNRPRELKFLTRLDGVRLVTFDRCPRRDHGTAYSACFTRIAGPMIVRYIRARLAAKP